MFLPESLSSLVLHRACFSHCWEAFTHLFYESTVRPVLDLVVGCPSNLVSGSRDDGLVAVLRAVRRLYEEVKLQGETREFSIKLVK